MMTLHFLRPYWLLSLIPLCFLALYTAKKSTPAHALQSICDAHLLPHLLQHSIKQKKKSWLFPISSLFFIILSLSGPAFIQFSTPVFKSQRAQMLVTDLSNTMLSEDIAPNRLQRAKFKLHDLFQQKKHTGQLGLIVYSGEAFVAAPLTEDTHTIDTLLDSLTPDIMPVAGNRLDSALWEAEKSIKQAGFSEGDILVITAEIPSSQAIEAAANLAKKNISVSILPLLPKQKINDTFTLFSKAGKGQMYPFEETSEDILSWKKDTEHGTYQTIDTEQFPRWRDDGRWFLIPALLFLLPLCRKNYFVEEQ
jgi:Ca-activated chloride channel homolog